MAAPSYGGPEPLTSNVTFRALGVTRLVSFTPTFFGVAH